MPKNIFAEGGTAGLNLDDGISYIGKNFEQGAASFLSDI